ncbi:hypothetical protein [Neptuniibacter sp. QD37_11]|uniref:hypothetical protein n=1 Tax=Neptuniibacter sp. QD37_11 TaxID=3398209 RepID=UPI0039F46BDF
MSDNNKLSNKACVSIALAIFAIVTLAGAVLYKELGLEQMSYRLPSEMPKLESKMQGVLDFKEVVTDIYVDERLDDELPSLVFVLKGAYPNDEPLIRASTSADCGIDGYNILKFMSFVSYEHDSNGPYLDFYISESARVKTSPAKIRGCLDGALRTLKLSFRDKYAEIESWRNEIPKNQGESHL